MSSAFILSSVARSTRNAAIARCIRRALGCRRARSARRRHSPDHLPRSSLAQLPNLFQTQRRLRHARVPDAIRERWACQTAQKKTHRPRLLCDCNRRASKRICCKDFKTGTGQLPVRLAARAGRRGAGGACCGMLVGDEQLGALRRSQRLPYPRRRPSGSRRSRPSLPPTDAWWAPEQAPAPWTRP